MDLKHDPFEEYYRQSEPSKRESAYYWQTAIGLQAVDGLEVSDYLKSVARQNIEGELSVEEVWNLLQSYYEEHPDKSKDRQEEADLVSARIRQILAEKAFTFSSTQYLSIHKRLFEGIYSHAGKIRDYNITKKEWVLDGDTVMYGGALELRETLEYDLSQEREFSYKDLSMTEVIRHLARFVSRLWQIHVFGEGNTRTTAVFFIRYLRTLGFDVTNDIFAKNAWYFRNAMVRANYTNLQKGVHETTEYLELFLRNLLLGETNPLHNRSMHISGILREPEKEPQKKYISVKEAANAWGITERVVRQYCADGRVPGAYVKGKTWYIPADSRKPARKPRQRVLPEDLFSRLALEKEHKVSGGIYHKVQIELTYNSNHMEGSRLTHDQTRYIFETNTIEAPDGVINVDDVVETVNHFRCIDLVIEHANKPLTENMIKQLHLLLKSGTADSRNNWFAVGSYKRLANEVGGRETAAPKEVPAKMKELLADYRSLDKVTFDDLLDFHYRFERIHPFQDGNGRIGRLILFKECLRNKIVPFIIEDDMKMFYYRGLQEWENERGYLRDTCLAAQDRFKKYLDYYEIQHE